MSYCPYTTVRGRRVAVPTAEQKMLYPSAPSALAAGAGVLAHPTLPRRRKWTRVGASKISPGPHQRLSGPTVFTGSSAGRAELLRGNIRILVHPGYV